MNKIFLDILNQVNEGIIILDEDLDILFWNGFIQEITGIDKEDALHKNIFTVLPNLKRGYFQESINNAFNKGYTPFFAAGMHRDLITDKAKLNVRVKAFQSNDVKLLMIECIDVTSQFLRVNQLKEYVQQLSDLNKRLREKEREIARLAYYDKLTSVANRTLFYSLGDKFLSNARRKQILLGLMFIDLDNFKCINDNYGHKAGDRVLIQVAEILTKSVRENDIVARYGGDEFIVLLPDLQNKEDTLGIAQRITERIENLQMEGMELQVTTSIGASFYPDDGETIDEMITKADRAMYQAKSIGGNQCVIYDEDMGNAGCQLTRDYLGENILG